MTTFRKNEIKPIWKDQFNSKQFEKAIINYNKTKKMKPLTQNLIKLILYMAPKAKYGYETKFLNIIPSIIELVKSLDLNSDKK